MKTVEFPSCEEDRIIQLPKSQKQKKHTLFIWANARARREMKSGLILTPRNDRCFFFLGYKSQSFPFCAALPRFAVLRLIKTGSRNILHHKESVRG